MTHDARLSRAWKLWGDAKAAVNQLGGQDRVNVDAHYVQAMQDLRKGDLEGAVEEMKGAANMARSTPAGEALLKVSQDMQELLSKEGQDKARALAALNGVFNVVGHLKDIKNQDLKMDLWHAQEHIHKGEYAQALQSLQNAVANAPDSARQAIFKTIAEVQKLL